jgi:hypothetical protein
MTEIISHHAVPTPRDLELVSCPECGHPAEIEWRDPVASSENAVEYLKIRCVSRHWFLMTSDRLDAA